MTKKNTLVGLIILAVASLLIVACSGPQATPEIPTVDANAIYTQAAETVQAGFAQTEAAKPTIEPTNTPAPTNTMEPDTAAGMTATADAILQPVAGDSPTLATTPVTLPTATSAVVAPAPQATGDKAELTGQSPSDGVNLNKNESFTMTIVLKNVGTTTWSTRYALAFYAGDRMGSPQDFNLPHEVKPNESVRLVFDMKAADSAGKKRTIWALRNADGVNFYDMWLETTVLD